MSKTYELIEATHPHTPDGRSVWQFYADEYASDECCDHLASNGYPTLARGLKELYGRGDLRGVVKLYDFAMEEDMKRRAAAGDGRAADWLDGVLEKDAVFELMQKYGIERTRRLIQLVQQSEILILRR